MAKKEYKFKVGDNVMLLPRFMWNGQYNLRGTVMSIIDCLEWKKCGCLGDCPGYMRISNFGGEACFKNPNRNSWVITKLGTPEAKAFSLISKLRTRLKA